METVYWPDSATCPFRPCACTIGVFDGVHAGHRAIIDRLKALAREAGVPAVVVSFDRHPAEVVLGKGPEALTPLPRRLALLAETGVAGSVVIRFTREAAEMPAEAFATRLLADYLGARAVVVGYNFRFGQGHAGSPALLESLGERLGFAVSVSGPHTAGDVVVSSTLIREHLSRGEVETAATLLCRPYEMSGTAAPGDGLGRRLGFPTANIAVTGQLVPAEGVYAGVAHARGRRYAAVVSIGRRETFHAEPDAARAVEAHLMGYSGEALYGEDVSVALHARLRGQERFASGGALREQIRRDVAEAVAALGRLNVGFAEWGVRGGG